MISPTYLRDERTDPSLLTHKGNTAYMYAFASKKPAALTDALRPSPGFDELMEAAAALLI